MSAIRFETQGPVVASAPNRADVACFVGFARRRRGTELPGHVLRWLRENGWVDGPYGHGPRAVRTLRNVPIPIDGWEVFDLLYEWERRELDRRGGHAGTYLGAAVRSFFAQGGRKCYVVRVGDPWRYDVQRGTRLARLRSLVPGYPHEVTATPADPATWLGVGVLFGLPDVSFLCLPDLPDALAVEPQTPEPIEIPPPPEERFVECSEEAPAEEEELIPSNWRAPYCEEWSFGRWAVVMRLLTEMVSRRAREVQLVAALPLLQEGMPVTGLGARFVAQDELLRFLVEGGWLAGSPSSGSSSVASAFVQLAYPWLRTPGSLRLPEGLEPPDAALVGMLARNALTRGTYRSAAGLAAGDVVDVAPGLRREQLERTWGDGSARRGPPRSLLERVSLFGPTPAGMRLLSDVTTSTRESYRPAPINRLVSVLVRAARRIGEEVTFEPSGEAVWRRVEERLSDLMLALLRAGALKGSTPAEAFEVRCDRTTMSQNDVDNGRVVARIAFRPTAPVERIVVLLALDEGGQISLASADALEAA